MTADVLAATIGGLLQPFARAFIARLTGYEPTTKKGQRWYTVGLTTVTLTIAIGVTWLTGGYRDVAFPAFTALDPSPLVFYLWPRFLQVYGLSHLVFTVGEKPIHKIEGTTA